MMVVIGSFTYDNMVYYVRYDTNSIPYRITEALSSENKKQDEDWTHYWHRTLQHERVRCAEWLNDKLSDVIQGFIFIHEGEMPEPDYVGVTNNEKNSYVIHDDVAYTANLLYSWVGSSSEYDLLPDTQGEWGFEAENAIQYLLKKDILFHNYIDYPYWREGDSESSKKTLSLSVLVNDVFAWGSADVQPISNDKSLELLCTLINEPYGLVRWASIQRNMKPQNPIVLGMKSAGVWDDIMEGLRENPSWNQCIIENCELHSAGMLEDTDGRK